MRLIMITFFLHGSLFAQLTAFPSKADFLKRCDYLTDKGGLWEADNPGFKSDEEFSPVAFGYKFERGFTPDILKLKINGKVGDKRYLYWEGYYYWHPIKNRAEYFSIGTSGSIARGETINDGWDLLFEITHPDGRVTVHLDTDQTDSAGQFTSKSYRFENGKWVENQVLIWKRIQD